MYTIINIKLYYGLKNNKPNYFNGEIKKYAKIQQFNLSNEVKNTFLNNYNYKNINTYSSITLQITYKSDYIRNILLFKYGGCWFDLDCLCLRSFDPLFEKYSDKIILYRWGLQNFPNNAIYISLIPHNPKMKQIILFIMNRQMGWGFQQAKITYNLPLNILVLPSSWFDPLFIDDNNAKVRTISIFKTCNKKCFKDLFIFCDGAFCYHWHNQWDTLIEDDSIIQQFIYKIKELIR